MSDGKKYRIIIADDHAMVRDALRCVLESRPEFEVVGEATDGQEAVRCTARLEPDLLVMDLSMPRTDGIEALKEVKRTSKRTRVLILTACESETCRSNAIKAGADGYVLKDAKSSDLLATITTILNGE